jgi:hypothetical protein
MKHCVYFEDIEMMEFKNSRPHLAVTLYGVLLTAVIMLSGCVKHEEIEFSGTVVDIRSCSSLELSMDQNPAFLVALDKPVGIGGVYYDDTNVVALYEPTRHIMYGDHIRGSFYLDDKYSKTTCEWHNTDYKLPEGVFTETIVD